MIGNISTCRVTTPQHKGCRIVNDPTYIAAANRTREILGAPGIPDYLLFVMTDTLDELAARYGKKIWSPSDDLLPDASSVVFECAAGITARGASGQVRGKLKFPVLGS